MILKYKLKKGQSSKYTTTVQSLREAKEGKYYEKVESKIEMTMTQNVIEVHSNGIIDLKVSIDSSILWKNGEEVAINKKDKIFIMKMADNGEVITTSGTETQSPPAFPNREINPGDIWTSEKEISIPSQPEGIILKTTYKFEGFEKFTNVE